MHKISIAKRSPRIWFSIVAISLLIGCGLTGISTRFGSIAYGNDYPYDSCELGANDRTEHGWPLRFETTSEANPYWQCATIWNRWHFIANTAFYAFISFAAISAIAKTNLIVGQEPG